MDECAELLPLCVPFMVLIDKPVNLRQQGSKQQTWDRLFICISPDPTNAIDRPYFAGEIYFRCFFPWLITV
jgi:hypothetical protein